MAVSFADKVAFIWSVANLLRGSFKRGEYEKVILPFAVLRRIDAVLAPTKDRVFETNERFRGRLDNPDQQLRRASGYAVYNTSRFDFERLVADAPNVAANLRNYVNGFSDNMREVLEKFDFDNTISRLDGAGLLFLIVEKFKTVDLHPDRVPNEAMGSIFEELIRKFNEALNENPGEHFTPREVIHLMVDLLLSPDEAILGQAHLVRKVSDPCCGSGGMLTIAKDRIRSLSPTADVHLYGQEVNPQTFAVCKSDLYIKSADGRDADRILFGSTLRNDRHAQETFDYQLANPPYGHEWKNDEKEVRAEAARGAAGRFGAGLPRISDGQLLFLQHMLNRMTPTDSGGGRVAIVMNGSPLFTGDAGSGESEIRRWILEHDWLEAIVALPEQLFYNTGIATYVWLLTNRKEERRRGIVQLVDATARWVPMRKSLGDKRREISDGQIAEIVGVFRAFEESDVSKLFPTTQFGYRKIAVDRPLRLRFAVTPEALDRLREQKAFADLATSKRKDEATRAAEERMGRDFQEQLIAMLRGLPPGPYDDRASFVAALDGAAKNTGLRLAAPVKKAVLTALGERDETAAICRDGHGTPEPDTELRDYENVPLAEDVRAFFEREVCPHVPDAWIDERYRDPKDGELGRVGYEIAFNRYFYRYVPPRPLEEIEADLKALEHEILGLLQEVAG